MPSTTTLGENLDVQNGYAFKSELFSDGQEGMPLIRIRDLKRSYTKVRYLGDYKDEYVVNAGDYLIGMDGDFEIHPWKGAPGLLNQRVCRFRNFSDTIEPEYVYYAIQKNLRNIHASTAFVTVKHLSSKQIKAIEIPYPALVEQRRIIDILNRADSIRCLRKQANDTARQLIPALFIEMFGDPATNPKGWPMGTIGDVITQAQYGTSKKAHENGAGLPVIRMGNVLTSGALDLEKLKYVELDEKDQAKYRLDTGDILFNRTNSKDLVGKTGMWGGEFEAVAASYFIVARADRSNILPIYLWAYMNTSHMKRRLFDTARGAIGQSNINAKELKAFSIPLPPTDLQEKFEARLEGIHSILGQQEVALNSADSCFQSLLHRAFND